MSRYLNNNQNLEVFKTSAHNFFQQKITKFFFFESLKTNTLKQFHLEANFPTVSLIFEEFY